MLLVCLGWLGKTSQIRHHVDRVSEPCGYQINEVRGKALRQEHADVFGEQQGSQGGQIRVSRRGRRKGGEVAGVTPHSTFVDCDKDSG